MLFIHSNDIMYIKSVQHAFSTATIIVSHQQFIKFQHDKLFRERYVLDMLVIYYISVAIVVANRY